MLHRPSRPFTPPVILACWALSLAAHGGCSPAANDDDGVDIVEQQDAGTQSTTKKDAAVKRDSSVEPQPADVAPQTEKRDTAPPVDPAKDAAVTTSPGDAGAPADTAAPADAGDGTFDLSITGTSMSFRSKVLPVLIRRCGACHEVFKDPKGPAPDKANEDEIRALQWVRGKTTCAKAVVKEKALVNPERKTNKDLFDDLESAKKSYIWHKLTNAADICGSPMPKPAAGAAWKRLDGDEKSGGTELFIIFDWIAHGAG